MIDHDIKPGDLVKSVKHSHDDDMYNNVWLWNIPDEFDIENDEQPSQTLVASLSIGDIVLVIASVVVYNCRWVLALTRTGHIGWTDELEGLELCD